MADESGDLQSVATPRAGAEARAGQLFLASSTGPAGEAQGGCLYAKWMAATRHYLPALAAAASGAGCSGPR